MRNNLGMLVHSCLIKIRDSSQLIMCNHIIYYNVFKLSAIDIKTFHLI